MDATRAAPNVEDETATRSENHAGAMTYEETLTLSTYAYEQTLVASPDFPYPTLDVNRIGPASLKNYRAVLRENDTLRLTFLPELGGRLYQMTDKATGRDLLYNNPVVKPTRWGPPEMNWWLAASPLTFKSSTAMKSYWPANRWDNFEPYLGEAWRYAVPNPGTADCRVDTRLVVFAVRPDSVWLL